MCADREVSFTGSKYEQNKETFLSKWPPHFPCFCQLVCRMETGYSHTRTIAKRGSTVAPGLQTPVWEKALVPVKQTDTRESSALPHRSTWATCARTSWSGWESSWTSLLCRVEDGSSSTRYRQSCRLRSSAATGEDGVHAFRFPAKASRRWSTAGAVRRSNSSTTDAGTYNQEPPSPSTIPTTKNHQHPQPRTTITNTYNQEPPTPTTKNHCQKHLQPRTNNTANNTCNQEPPTPPTPTTKNHHQKHLNNNQKPPSPTTKNHHHHQKHLQ